jgi:hypothetical protein
MTVAELNPEARRYLRWSESSFQAHVIELAKLYKWLYFHPWNSMHSVKGYPDLTMVRRDRIVFAELKVGKRQPTAAQLEWLNALGLAGRVEVYLWQPDDMPEIERVLR